VSSASRVGFEVEALRRDLSRLESKVKELEDTRVSGRTLSEKLQGLRTDVLQRVELKLRGGSDSL
jgi:ribosomal protein S6E (S10)